jgi:hypothetical protein
MISRFARESVPTMKRTILGLVVFAAWLSASAPPE